MNESFGACDKEKAEDKALIDHQRLGRAARTIIPPQLLEKGSDQISKLQDSFLGSLVCDRCNDGRLHLRNPNLRLRAGSADRDPPPGS